MSQVVTITIAGIVAGVVITITAPPIAAVVMVLGLAAVCSVGACVIGNLWIAVLERRAIAWEFDREALAADDFFIALEAYLGKYSQAASSPPFTDVAGRPHYTDSEWQDATERWQRKSEDERDRIRAKWRSDYAALARIGDRGILDVFVAPWHLMTYAISAAIGAGTVVLIRRSRARNRRPP